MEILKKNSPMILNLISILLIIVSICSITTKGIMEYQSTYYETISFTDKPFHLAYGDQISYPILNIVFWIALFLLVLSDIIFYKKSNIRSILLTIVNLTGIIYAFLLYLLYRADLFMTAIVVTMISLQIVLQTIYENKKASKIVTISSICIWIINIYFLLIHYVIGVLPNGDLEGTSLNKLIKVSQINAVSITLFLIPCIIDIVYVVVTTYRKTKAEGD